MAPDPQETPFVKQLAASDRATREAALSSLRTYLTSGRTFSALELLKIWKGLFFCTPPSAAQRLSNCPQKRCEVTKTIGTPLTISTGVFHTDRPLPQQRISQDLAILLLQLPTELFIPFLHAFWTTIVSYWSQIPSLRLDKYLYLIRLSIVHSFIYLSEHNWDDSLVESFLHLIEELPLSPSNGKVPDGLRYHVLDIWVDGLVQLADWGRAMELGLMKPVERLSSEGLTKVVRGRAGEVLKDERLSKIIDGEAAKQSEAVEPGDEDHDFEGFRD